MANVTVENFALKDPRFVILGQLLGTSKWDARGRMLEVWSHCTELNTYCVSDSDLAIIVEREDFAEKLVASRLGERVQDGIVRICGTRTRIEWLAKKRKGSEKGGVATRAKHKTMAGPYGPVMAYARGGPIGMARGEPIGNAQYPALSGSIRSGPEDPEKSIATPAEPQVRASRSHPDFKAFREFFNAIYAEHTGGQAPTWDAKQNGMATKLLKQHGLEIAKQRATVLYHDPPSWLSRGGGVFDLGTLVQHFDKLARAEPVGAGKALSMFDKLNGKHMGDT